jgi:hypothetical protein
MALTGTITDQEPQLFGGQAGERTTLDMEALLHGSDVQVELGFGHEQRNHDPMTRTTANDIAPTRVTEHHGNSQVATDISP